MFLGGVWNVVLQWLCFCWEGLFGNGSKSVIGRRGRKCARYGRTFSLNLNTIHTATKEKRHV